MKALVFDVFGTCVDWRGSVIRALDERFGAAVDSRALADEWRREGYIGPIRQILAGELPYVSSDDLFLRKLEELLPRYGVGEMPAAEVAELARAWRRLDPWPDTVEGLTRLRQRFVIAPLSNGTFATLTAMAKRAGLPWDCIISTELRQTYKPAREAYLLAGSLLDLPPDQVMLVAAHANDLAGARAAGLGATALVHRPLEWGAEANRPAEPEADCTYVAHDFVQLADKLGC